MKEKINAVQSYPLLNKVVIRVYRQLDRFHVPVYHEYSAFYSEPEKVRKLSKMYMRLVGLVQERVLEYNIKCWQEKMR